MPERPELALVDDADVMIASLGRHVHPFRQIELLRFGAFEEAWQEHKLFSERRCYECGTVLNALQVREDLSEIRARTDNRGRCGARRVPMPARSQPASERRQHELLGFERQGNIRHTDLQRRKPLYLDGQRWIDAGSEGRLENAQLDLDIVAVKRGRQNHNLMPVIRGHCCPLEVCVLGKRLALLVRLVVRRPNGAQRRSILARKLRRAGRCF